MIKRFNLFYGIALVASLLVVASCGSRGKKSVSSTTGWKYNDPKNGGFEVKPFIEQQRGPGLVLIEGGTFTMGTNDR